MQNSKDSDSSSPLSRRLNEAMQRLSGINAVLSDAKVPATQRAILAATIAYMAVMGVLALKEFSEKICYVVSFAYLICVIFLFISGRGAKGGPN